MLVDDEDYELMSRLSWRAQKDSSGNWRPFATVRPQRLLVDAPLIDHVNCDPFDNRKINLRAASKRQNAWNRPPDRRNVTGFKGVYPNKQLPGTYEARIQVDHKRIYLGHFHDPSDAARAYDKAASQYYGEFAWLNFPVERGDAGCHVLCGIV